MTAVEKLDRFYSDALGCSIEELNSSRTIAVPSDNVLQIRFAKGGAPLAVYGLSKGRGAVLSLLPHLAEAVRAAIGDLPANGLDDHLCNILEQAIRPLVRVRLFFRGRRFYSAPESFIDRSFGEVRDVADEDEDAWHMRDTWGGPVFGQIIDGRVVTWCAVKPLSEVIWDLSIETRPEYRGRGYARSAASAAVRHCFENGRLVGWGCNRHNIASIRTALSVGFRDYALDFGCEHEAPGERALQLAAGRV